MRFLEGGPSIPDELLVARDEGRVVFFCGAGVSQARAGLADFFGLAQKVVDALGATDDSPPRRILQESKGIQDRTGIGGLVSADKVFSLLERDFSVRDIEAAVAKALKPSQNPDLSAHKIMLDLAKTAGKTKLVTTNFDLLFEECDNSLDRFCSHRLPDPRDVSEFDGIVHLHGCVEEGYQRPFGDGFVLSSSDFGRAYLAEGTATTFIKSILDQYIVVFVGYAADDPPVQYLLEALRRTPDSYDSIYAFQSGSHDEAERRWRHKGVVPIDYSEANCHKALWDTLKSWACRAKDPNAWNRNVILNARKGPEALTPYERGQIAHIVSSLDGMRQFASFDEPPPAEWLCVFDPLIRYSNPRNLGNLSKTRPERGQYFDPFSAYGLDSDPVPQDIPSDNQYIRRDVPLDAWSCFTATKGDRQNLEANHIATPIGADATDAPSLPERLRLLGHWIGRIAKQPSTAWWAAEYKGLHPSIQDEIRREMWLQGDQFPATVRKAWGYIFESCEQRSADQYIEFERLKKTVKLDGWSSRSVRQYSLLIRPNLRIKRPFFNGPKPPKNEEDIKLKDVVDIDVAYPQYTGEPNIPDEFLVPVIKEYRRNLEFAVSLEKEVHFGSISSIIKPIVRDPNVQTLVDGVDTIEFLFRSYLELVKRLIEKDKDAATQEYRAWDVDDDTVFARLRIWFTGEPNLISKTEAGRLIHKLSDEAFWDEDHQRDLLLVLQKRWNDYSATARMKIENRLLKGREPWPYEDAEHYEEWSTRLSLNRIHWLNNHGCQFDFDLQSETKKLLELAPDWKPEHAKRAADSRESRGGMVQTITEYDELLSHPLVTLIEKAAEIDEREEDFLKKRDCFSGLSTERPVLAFSALVSNARKEQYPVWAWKKFLYSHSYPGPNKQGKPLTPRFIALIMEWISRLPSRTLSDILRPVSQWLYVSCDTIYASCSDKLDSVWKRLIEILETNPESKESTISDGRRRDWTFKAVNSATGKLAEMLLKDPVVSALKKDSGFPCVWIARVEGLLSLGGDSRRYALFEFAAVLNWFYEVDPTWTKNNILCVLEKKDDDQSAFWAAYLWHQQRHGRDLYLVLKPHLLKLADRDSDIRKSHTQTLAIVLLTWWGRIDEVSGSRFVTDHEMRTTLLKSDEEFRLQTLRHIERWYRNNEADWETKCPIFLGEVWPRQKAAKSPKVSTHLCQVALSNTNEFPAVAEVVESLVGKTSQNSLRLYGVTHAENSVAKKHPKETLRFFYAILPENVTEWPYGFNAVLEKIGEADGTLRRDSRFLEIKRRWDGR